MLGLFPAELLELRGAARVREVGVLPEDTLVVLEELGDATRFQPAHPDPGVMGLRSEQHSAVARGGRARTDRARVPSRPPAEDLGLGGWRGPQLNAIAIAAVHLVRAGEACCRGAGSIRAGLDLERLKVTRSAHAFQPDPAGAKVQARLADMVPLVEIVRRLALPELDPHRHVAAANCSHRDDSLRGSEVALETTPVPDEIGASPGRGVDDVELRVRRVNLGLGDEPRGHPRSVVRRRTGKLRAANPSRTLGNWISVSVRVKGLSRKWSRRQAL
ncbi:MAG: hypothetical protein H0U05_01390 [Actinobacteria bacterium]|nr:hypothetical protein [Actinomycetota bacterium]